MDKQVFSPPDSVSLLQFLIKCWTFEYMEGKNKIDNPTLLIVVRIVQTLGDNDIELE